MSAPVKHTCSKIDSLIRNVNDLLDAAESWDPEINRDVLYYLSDFEHNMEELRAANSLLRDWGEELEKHANDLESECVELRKESGELNDRIRELEDIAEKHK